MVTKSNLKIVNQPSPERAELAAAIDKAHQAEAAAQRLREAVARADSAVADAEKIQSDAAKAVVTATEAHARTFEAALEQGHPVGRDTSVRDARRQADDVADELATARAAAAALKAKLRDAENVVRDLRIVIEACAQNIALVELPRLLGEAQRMQGELEARRQVLWLLSSVSRNRANTAFQSDVEDFLAAPVVPFEYNGGEPEQHPAAAPWLAAIEAMKRGDANAPLPAN